MKRLILIAIFSLSLLPVSCKVDRGTLISLPFFSIFSNTASPSITAFAINGVQGTITGTDIALTLPCDATLNDLVASFTITGARVAVNGVDQVNGVTRNDFTNPVVYTVFSSSNTSKSYTVNATVANYSEKAITLFSINGVNATISGTSISLVLPYGTDPSALVATFNITGHMVTTVKTGVQESGVTINDFTNPVTYTVEACDGSMQSYTVTVGIASSDSKDIIFFSVGGASVTNPGTDINLTVHCATDRSMLVASFTATGQKVTIDSASGAEQYTGVNVIDFTTPRIYVVTAADGTTKSYTVTVNLSSDSNHNFTSFSINGVDATPNNTDHTISLELPCGTDRTALVATFTNEGHKVYVGTTEQQSGATPNNFTSPSGVTYTVEACDGYTVVYTVTVTLGGGDSKNITSFSFDSVSGEIVDINDTAGTIIVLVPCLTDLSDLVATFNTTGNKVTTAETGVQTSGVTHNDFTNPIVYTVIACDDTKKYYTVTVTPTGCDNKDITKFSLFGRDSDPITSTSIGITVPWWAELSKLTPTIVITGNSVDPASGSEVDFSSGNQHAFTVTSVDGNSTQVYTVTVNPSSKFLLPGTYAAGYYHDGTKNNACLWDITDPGGHKIDLTDNTVESRAVSVSVSGDASSNTIYVAGIYNGNACYWKINDSDTSAPAPVILASNGDVMVVDSVILGTDLYISGTNDVNGTSEASYWKIDLTGGISPVRTTLTDGAGGQACEMTQSGGTIYIAGTSASYPVYWIISGGTDSLEKVINATPYNARTIMFYNTYFYVGGSFAYYGAYTQAWYAYFNSPPVSAWYDLPYKFASSDPNSSTVYGSLNVSGSRYIVGQRPLSNSSTAAWNACYWQITGTTTMTATGNNLNGSGISKAYEIALTDAGDVYISGYYNASNNSGASSSACVWMREGGSFTHIPLTPNDPAGESAARDVFVKN